tara:strand:+ start:3037 stop:4584 length:1548 start_codon:yes stop_codon:yes gene_type:complete
VIRWQRNLLSLLYIAMESLPWFVALSLLATIGERGHLAELARELRFFPAEDFTQGADHQAAVIEVLWKQSEVVTAGPQLWAIAAAGLGGFWLMSYLRDMQWGGMWGAIVLLVVSVFGLAVVLHLSFAQDFMVWENSGFAVFIDDPGLFLASGTDYKAIVDSGGATLRSASAIAVTFTGLIAVWLRFLYVGRYPLRFNHLLRSFGFGFVVLLVSLVVASLNDLGHIAIYAIPFFMLGLLTLAVSNGERAALHAEGTERATSWGMSVTVTVAFIVVLASACGLLAVLDVSGFLGYLGGYLGKFIVWALMMILTPIFWVLTRLYELLLADHIGKDQFLGGAPAGPPEVQDDLEQGEFTPPGWLFDALKVLLFVTLVWVCYRLARLLLAIRESVRTSESNELRSDAGGETHLNSLFRKLLRRRSRVDGSGWSRLRPIYGVYHRSVISTEERGLERRLSETPLEYATAAGSTFRVPLFGEIAEAFDAARYGEHEVDLERVQRWDDDLASWERDHPPTEQG